MPTTRQNLIMVLLMTLMMGIVMSAWFTWQVEGYSASFFAGWVQRFFSTYIIVLPTVLLVAPVAQKLSRLVNDHLEANGVGPGAGAIALQAWQHNASGHNGHGFAGWFSMLASDVSISMPLGPFRGDNHGIETARQIYNAIASATPRLVYEKPLRITETGQTVVIEFDDHGTIAGYAYKNRIAASFDIRNGKVAAYREYFGDVDPAMVKLMNGGQ